MHASRIYSQRLTGPTGATLAKEWSANVNLPFSLRTNSIAVLVMVKISQHHINPGWLRLQKNHLPWNRQHGALLFLSKAAN
jgi:hypothetical protein